MNQSPICAPKNGGRAIAVRAGFRRHQRRRVLARQRTLYRQHRQIAPLQQPDVEIDGVRADPGQVLVARAGVDHQAEMVVGNMVGDQVVETPPSSLSMQL